MKKRIELKDGWNVKMVPPDAAPDIETLNSGEGESWYSSRMPEQVHEILLRHKIIEDPTKLGKAEECLWVAENDWVYRCSFAFHETGKKTYLHFRGLDTLADVYLNGSHLASHNDMYLPLRAEATDLLREENVLLVHFHSPHYYIKHAQMPAEWEGKVAPHRLLRKGGNDFTDYLGQKPYLTPIGIYDTVTLEVVDEMEIEEADVSATLLPGYKTGVVRVKASGSGSLPDGKLTLTVTAPDGQALAVSAPAAVCGGAWRATLYTEIENPQLWWPRGFGGQPLYRAEVSLSAGGAVRDTLCRNVGFRDAVMKETFDFWINGRQIKLWGAQSVQLQGITHCWNPAKGRKMLDMIENCNMNALRVWGSSDRYGDELYDDCDRRGILVWQEFFHDYGMYPENPEYRALCRKEAEFQVKRLRHHASLLFWCGGNECVMGAEFSFPGERCIGADIFLKDYTEVCETLDPGRYFHINSPWGGDFTNDPMHGDTHSYTNTWYVPGADYPVMVAEEIRPSPPNVKTMLRYFDGEKAWPDGYTGKITPDHPLPWPEIWEERASAQADRKIPNIELFYDPVDLPSMIYQFGAAHSLYMRKILENNRRGRPSNDPEGERICKGHFVCRWNDCWPAIYGSFIDYYWEPFMHYYATKRAFQPVLISFDVGNFINVWIVNDSAEKTEGTLSVRLFDPNRNCFVRELTRQISVESGKSRLITDLNEFQQFSREYILFAELTGKDGTVLVRSNDFVDIEKKLRFPDAKLTLAMEGDVLTVTADRFARSIELSGSDDGDEFGFLFEDNFFDLLPGEVKKVRILGEHRKGRIRAKAYYSKSDTEIDWR